MMRKISLGLIALVAVVICCLAAFRLAADLRETQDARSAAPSDGRFVSTREGEVFIIERGSPAAPPLLFVHGTGAWSALWEETLDAIAMEGYRAVAMDLTPFGFSERAPNGDYSAHQQANRILALLDALDIKPVLVAHSFGASPAAEAALKQPSRFSGIVLVAGALGIDAPPRNKLPLPLRNAAVRQWVGAATALNPWLTETLLKQMLHNKEAATQARLDTLQKPLFLKGTSAAFADWLPHLLVPQPDMLSNKAVVWENQELPLALIWGREDRLTPPEQAQHLSDLTGAPIHWLDNVGHIPHIEAPDAFQNALIEALVGLE